MVSSFCSEFAKLSDIKSKSHLQMDDLTLFAWQIHDYGQIQYMIQSLVRLVQDVQIYEQSL